MFVLSKSAGYYWPVKFAIPVDGGKYEDQSFEAYFRRVPMSRVRDLLVAIQDEKMKDFEFVAEIMIGWRGVSNEAGDIAFSETALKELLDIPGVSQAIVLAFSESINGAPRKN